MYFKRGEENRQGQKGQEREREIFFKYSCPARSLRAETEATASLALSQLFTVHVKLQLQSLFKEEESWQDVKELILYIYHLTLIHAEREREREIEMSQTEHMGKDNMWQRDRGRDRVVKKKRDVDR